MNTMEDLRREVARRMKRTLDGREIDVIEQGVRPRIPHMIGVTPVGRVHDPNNEEDTLMDHNHEFWQSYAENITTKSQVDRKIQTAIESLSEDNLLRISWPQGREAEIMYVEVDIPNRSSKNLQTTCPECDSLIQTGLNLLQNNDQYNLNLLVDCDNCEYSTKVGRALEKL